VIFLQTYRQSHSDQTDTRMKPNLSVALGRNCRLSHVLTVFFWTFLLYFTSSMTSLAGKGKPAAPKVKISSCNAWFIDIGCGFGVASEIFLQSSPMDWTFETESYPGKPDQVNMHGRTGEHQVKYDFESRGFTEMISQDSRVVPEQFCFAGLDGNPFFQEKLELRSEEFGQRGYYAKFIAPGIISDKDGKETFFLDTKNIKVNYWGSSMFDTSSSVDGGKTKVTVPSFTLRVFFEKIGVKPSDLVILHMNAEGGEFLAIPQAINDGTLCEFVDHLTLDIHHKIRPNGVNVFDGKDLREWTKNCSSMKTITIW